MRTLSGRRHLSLDRLRLHAVQVILNHSLDTLMVRCALSKGRGGIAKVDQELFMINIYDDDSTALIYAQWKAAHHLTLLSCR